MDQMPRLPRPFAMTCLSVLTFLATVPASADMMYYNGLALTSVVRIHGPVRADGVSGHAGQYSYEYGGRDYRTYCVDLDHWAGTSSVTERPVEVLRNWEQIAFLYETYGCSAQTGIEAAAVGTAIWELLYESPGQPYDLSTACSGSAGTRR